MRLMASDLEEASEAARLLRGLLLSSIAAAICDRTGVVFQHRWRCVGLPKFHDALTDSSRASQHVWDPSNHCWQQLKGLSVARRMQRLHVKPANASHGFVLMS